MIINIKISEMSDKENIIFNEGQANYIIDIFGDDIIPKVNKINKLHEERNTNIY